ncbi:hypothetical protein HPB51_011514 [Rhipicephalus microplus]|uniref:Uncharacterized protein n=1 Tax=Rhipicephalus microplus TaxID=6941 RepID=A0A9J6E8S0_RHIMP|nr:hypothetical protein HPB51_011514 [Rhipicephalus microplus]
MPPHLASNVHDKSASASMEAAVKILRETVKRLDLATAKLYAKRADSTSGTYLAEKCATAPIVGYAHAGEESLERLPATRHLAVHWYKGQINLTKRSGKGGCLACLTDPVTNSSEFLRLGSNTMNYRSSTEFRHVHNSGPGGVDAPISLARDSPGLFVVSSAGVLRAIIYDDDILVPSIVDQQGSVTSSARHKRTSSTPAFFSGQFQIPYCLR